MIEPTTPRRREMRLLLVTIAVSVGMLLLLARFRFPDESGGPTPEVGAAPLERLAARATYDELAAIMADLERRIAPTTDVLRIQPERSGGGFIPAPRLTADRAVVLLTGDERVVAGSTAGVPIILGRDATRNLAVVAVQPRTESQVAPRVGPPRPGPRYVAVVEATQQGLVVRPVYVGRMDLVQDPRSNTPVLSVTTLQQTMPRGAAVFALDGQFIGIASEMGGAVTIVPAESLRTLAVAAQVAPAMPGDLGIEVQALTAALSRASGADRGVMVTYVHPHGPAADLVLSGDVIQSIDETGVTTVGGFQQVVSSRQPGATVGLDVIRQGKPTRVNVRAVGAGMLAAAPPAGDHSGATLRTVDGVGVEVVAVEPDSAAARADLQPGDLIVAVNGAAPATAPSVERAFRSTPRGSALLLTLRRGVRHRVTALEKP